MAFIRKLETQYGQIGNLWPLDCGSLPRSQIIDRFKTIKVVDVILPTPDNRTVILPRHIEPPPDTAHLLAQLVLTLPSQPPPKGSAASTSRMAGSVVKTDKRNLRKHATFSSGHGKSG